MNQFVDVFVQEASELIDELEESLLILESTPDDLNSINSVFRVMHTLKGSAKMFGFDQMDKLTHQLENVYDNIRNSKSTLNKEVLEITLSTVDHLRNLRIDPTLEQPENLIKQQELVKQIQSILQPTELDSGSNEEIAKKTEDQLGTYYIAFHPARDIMCDGSNPVFILEDLSNLGKVKISAHKNDIPDFKILDPTLCYTFWEIYLVTEKSLDEIQDVFLFVDDTSDIKIHKVADEDLLKHESFIEKIEEIKHQQVLIDVDELQQYVNHLLQIIRQQTLENNSKIESSDQKIANIRVSSDKIDHMMNLVSELVTTQARLKNISGEINSPALTAIAETVEKLSRQLRDNVFSVSLVPIKNLFVRFQRLVRDISLELGKTVDFQLEGGDTEIDKNLVDSLSDPMMHILRNCLDHGIETPENRLKKGKSKVGKIVLKAYYSGANVIIKVSDDGAGLNLDKIRQKAIDKGLVEKNIELDNKQITDLLFSPGFSMTDQITDLSGRGVGMDIVRKKITELGGSVTMNSEIDQGTSLIIKLPLTLSIIDGLLVTVNQISFVIQVGLVNKISPIAREEVAECYNDLVTIDGEQIQIIDLRKEFEYGASTKNLVQVIVVEYEGIKFGIVVDSVAGQIQTVIKPLGKMYRDQEYISGATILGDGSVALILDTNKLIGQSINTII